MSNQQPNIVVTVEQLFKLVQQNIRLWARPGALARVYTQAVELAQLLDSCYQSSPDKTIAQLHLHKPHFDYLTNLTAKAAIFAADQVSNQGWSEHSRISIIAATLTCNVAVLPHLLKQSRGERLTDKQKLAVAKSAQLSYQLLKKNQVLDPLWLHAVLTSSRVKVTKHYPVGIHGDILTNAYRFAKPLCRGQSIGNVSVGQILRQLFLDNHALTTAQIVNNAAKRINDGGSGALVMLSNNQAALLMHSKSPGKYLAFMFAEDKISGKGRFVTIGDKHISAHMALYQCDQPKLYSQLWEGPLTRFAEEKQIALEQPPAMEIDILSPPKIFSRLLNQLFDDNPDIKKLSSAIDDTRELKTLLTRSATEASQQKLQISDTKHALAMLGLNRIGPLMTQGVLHDLVSKIHFPGENWLHARQNCFLQACVFYGKHNDLVLAEEQSMYGAFFMAPYFVDIQVQKDSYQLYRGQTIEARDAFSIELLLNGRCDEHHRDQHRQLAELWQLPKLSREVLRQLAKADEDEKVAKTVQSVLAVIRLAAFHCHTIFNQVDINNPLLQQRLRGYLKVLGLSFERYLALQDDFLLQYSPFTPLY